MALPCQNICTRRSIRHILTERFVSPDPKQHRRLVACLVEGGRTVGAEDHVLLVGRGAHPTLLLLLRLLHLLFLFLLKNNLTLNGRREIEK